MTRHPTVEQVRAAINSYVGKSSTVYWNRENAQAAFAAQFPGITYDAVILADAIARDIHDNNGQSYGFERRPDDPSLIDVSDEAIAAALTGMSDEAIA